MDMETKENLDNGGQLRPKDLKGVGVTILLVTIILCGLHIASLFT